MKEKINLGSRRELFLDDGFVSSLEGHVTRVLHHPEPAEVVLTLNEPHEGMTNDSGTYNSIVFDGTRYLVYYRCGCRMLPSPQFPKVDEHGSKLCVAESTDGIHFKRSQVNLLSSGYNAVLDTTKTRHLVPESRIDICSAVTTVFYDTNPACPENERYKMIVTNERADGAIGDGTGADGRGMYLFVSPDGFDFHQKTGKFALHKDSGYDSANKAFYDPTIGKYRLYSRAFKMAGPDWKRVIFSHTTEDFETFTPQGLVEFNDAFDALFALGQELYTNNIEPYFRAPQILMGFPMRYVEGSRTDGLYATEKDWDIGVLSRPDLATRAFDSRLSPRYGLAATDTVLITSRDGVHFQGYGDSFMTAAPTQDSWHYGSGTLFIGMMTTPSPLGNGAPDELSFLSSEHGWSDTCNEFRRYRLRMDGFVSLHFGYQGGVYISPLFIFEGGILTLNMQTGAFGGFQVEFRDENNGLIPGYTFADSYREVGDALDIQPRWKERGNDLRPLEGKTVRMYIYGRNCDLYSLKFEPYRPDPELPSIVHAGPVNRPNDVQKPQ